MLDNLAELLDIAINKEIEARNLYIASQSKTEDPGAKTMMEELLFSSPKLIQLQKRWLQIGERIPIF